MPSIGQPQPPQIPTGQQGFGSDRRKRSQPNIADPPVDAASVAELVISQSGAGLFGTTAGHARGDKEDNQLFRHPRP
jgi:hypothetical protein